MVSNPADFLSLIPVVRKMTNVTLCTFAHSMYCRMLRGRGRGKHVRDMASSHACGATGPKTPINDTYYNYTNIYSLL